MMPTFATAHDHTRMCMSMRPSRFTPSEPRLRWLKWRESGERPPVTSPRRSVGGPPVHPELTAEQEYLDRAHDHLTAMQATATRLADVFAITARTDMNDAAVQHNMRRYLAALDIGQGNLCFGRIDEDAGDRWYIGRRHVEDDRGDPVVIDWRAGVATPFYRATFADPLGLARRRRFMIEGRRIVDLFDEDFADPESARRGSGIPDPLLAELDRSRTGTMRDIV